MTEDGRTITYLELSPVVVGQLRVALEGVSESTMRDADPTTRSHFQRMLTDRVVGDLFARGFIDRAPLHSTFGIGHDHLLKSCNDVARQSSTPDASNATGFRGLHVDNWEEPRLPLSERRAAGHRLVVNIGTEPRHFLFADTPVHVLYEDVMSSSAPQPSATILGHISASTFAGPLAEWYMATSRPDVFAIEMLPGTAVFAPVQNVIHDGYLIWKRQPDVVLLVSFGGRALAADY